jgi:hypothetical protein
MAKQVILWTLLTILILFITPIFLTGCAQNQQIKSQPICLASMDLQSVMNQTEMVLLKMNFIVDKADISAGIMRTKPLPGSQFFEFWKKDNLDGYNVARSNLHSIQKTAELNFIQKNDLLCIDCNVTVERLSIPEKEIDSSARAYSMFSGSSETTQRLDIEGDQLALMEWIDLGRDGKLETAILDKIHKKLTGKKGVK